MYAPAASVEASIWILVSEISVKSTDSVKSTPSEFRIRILFSESSVPLILMVL